MLMMTMVWLANGDPPLIGVNKGTMTTKRLGELVARYGVLSNYVCRGPIIDEYISIPGPLEISV